MLVTAALSENICYQAFDVDQCSVLIQMTNTAAFYMALRTQNVKIQLYTCLCYFLLRLYINDQLIQDELCRQISLFTEYWDNALNVTGISNHCLTWFSDLEHV